jgi:hypothetical protein
VNANFVAVPGLMVIAVLTAEVSPLLVAVSV